jgi:asparagine synthase (glutamine-hydrolysing)
MSGLCGWFSHEPPALPIERMAAPLLRFDHAVLRSTEHGAGALALAARPDGGRLLQQDGLAIAVCGERVELLARLWESHGPKACAAFSGSFSFAILDARRDQALLAVDRNASRPLFYQQVGRTLVFASSAEALVQHPGVGRQIDPQAIYNYLYFHNVPGPGAIYKGQRRLLPGEYLHFQGGRLARGRYWKIAFHETQDSPDAELRDELLDTLRSAVQGALAQHPAGVLLGGGAGGTAIAAMLAAADPGRSRSYAVGFEAGGDAALVRARQLARRLGSVHRERRIGPGEVADAVPLLAAVFDQPLGAPAALAAYYGALMAREDGVARLLGGHGCAELFGARPEYARQAHLSRYERIPSALRQTLIEPLLFRLAGGFDLAALRRARAYIEQALAPLPARLEQGRLLQGYGGAALLEADFLASVDASAPAGLLAQSCSQLEAGSEINQLIALDLKYGLAERQLPAMAKACELAGIEAAFPFLNDALVAFAARLAPARKRDALRRRGLWPLAVAAPGAHAGARALPFGHWLQTDARLKGLAFDSLSDLKARRIVRADFIDSLLERRVAEHPARHGGMVWLLMMLEQWLAQRQSGAAGAPSLPKAGHEPETCRE